MTGRETSVLIVEDESALADSYAAWLEDEHSVRTAYTGEEAVAALDEETADVVLLDRRLPDLSGEAVLDAIDRRGHACRVVLVSAVEPDFDVIELGYDLYVEKPVTDAETLRSAVETLRRRDAYDARLRRYFSLASKQATLEATKTRAELRGNEKYQRLRSELESAAENLDDVMTRLDNEDFRVEFSRDRSAPGSGDAAQPADADAPTAPTGPETPGEQSDERSGPEDGSVGPMSSESGVESSGEMPEAEYE
jgi:DNA-binding response OmpR family regulator